MIIWGNHSSTQFPDVSQAYVENGGKKPVYEAVNDDAWLKGDFIKVRSSLALRERNITREEGREREGGRGGGREGGREGKEREREREREGGTEGGRDKTHIQCQTHVLALL